MVGAMKLNVTGSVGITETKGLSIDSAEVSTLVNGTREFSGLVDSAVVVVVVTGVTVFSTTGLVDTELVLPPPLPPPLTATGDSIGSEAISTVTKTPASAKCGNINAPIINDIITNSQNLVIRLE